MVHNCCGHYLWVNAVLQNCNLETTTIAADTDNQTGSVEVSLWPAKLACDGHQYIYPATDFNRLQVVFDFTQVPNQACLDYMSGHLYADLIWAPVEIRSPLRQIRRYLGSDSRVRIDGGGKTQIVMLSVAKGADANQWNQGLKIETSRSHWTISDGDALARHFDQNCCCYVEERTAADIAEVYSDVLQPVIHPYGLKCGKDEGITGVIKIERLSSNDPTPDAYVYSLRP